jgi:hypothetical protein
VTETEIVQKVCRNCGAEVRHGSLFCYGCGKSVTKGHDSEDSENLPAIPMPGSVPQTALPDRGVGVSKESERLPTPMPTAATSPRSGDPARRQSRSKRVKRSREEITWADPEGPGWGFILASVLVIFITGLLIVVAMLLR